MSPPPQVNFKKICKDRGIKFIDVSLLTGPCPEGMDREWWIDTSSCVGSIWEGGAPPEIKLGIYKDEPKRLISFFHELAHLTYNRRFREVAKHPATHEVLAWRRGFLLARQYGVYDIVLATIPWCKKQLLSYRDLFNLAEEMGWPNGGREDCLKIAFGDMVAGAVDGAKKEQPLTGPKYVPLSKSLFYT